MILRVALLLLTQLALAEGDLSEKPSDPKLLDFFTAEKAPGSGSLVYKHEGGSETIKLGEATGLYGLGIVFEGDQLPEPQKKEFAGREILQIALGTLRSRLQAQIPLFASGTLVTEGAILKRTNFTFKIPNGKPSNMQNVAFFLFNPPNTPNEQSDEDKLKGTYFSQSGTLIVTPKGKTQEVHVKSAGSKYSFRMQTVSFQIDAILATPFNSQEKTLKGKIEFPVYRPFGTGARELVKRMTSESFGGLGPIPSPEGLSSHSRDVAGSTKKDVPGK